MVTKNNRATPPRSDVIAARPQGLPVAHEVRTDQKEGSMIRLLRRRPASRSGIAIALVAVSLIIMLAMLSLALDVGWMMNTSDQLQNAADSAALAAAESLIKGQAEAIQMAGNYTLLNRAGEKYAQIDPNVDVVFGGATYDDAVGVWTFTPGAGAGAVQVTVRRTSTSPAGVLPLFFAGVLGRTTASISRTATAMYAPRDMTFAVDISGSMWHDSSFYHLFTHPREGTNAPISGLPINTFDVWVALNSLGEGQPFSTEATDHIQRRTETVKGKYQIYQEATNYPGNQGPSDSVYSGRSGPTWGVIGTAALPYGSNPDPATYSIEADPGLVFLPMGNFTFRAEPTYNNYSIAKVPSATSSLHTNGNDTQPGNGNLIGITANATVNGGLPTVLAQLSSRGYSEEEKFMLRMPQDNSGVVPGNPADPTNTDSNGKKARSFNQENTDVARWTRRVGVFLGFTDWTSNLIHPEYLEPPSNINSMKLGAGYTVSPAANTDWNNEVANGDYSLRINPVDANGIASGNTVTLPKGKCFVSNAVIRNSSLTYPGLDKAYYKASGADGVSWSNNATLQTTLKDTGGTNDTGYPGGWMGAAGAPYRSTNVHYGTCYNASTKKIEKRWVLPVTTPASYWVNPENGPYPIGSYHRWLKDAGAGSYTNLAPSATALSDPSILNVTNSNFTTTTLTPEIQLTLGDLISFIQNPIFPTDDGAGGGSYPQQARLLQWRFGVKTFVEKMMQLGQFNTNDRLPQAPLEPFQIERDIVYMFAQILKTGNSSLTDHAGLITFNESAQVQNNNVDLTGSFDSLWSLDYLHNNNVAFGGTTTPIMAVMPRHMTNNNGTSVGACIRRALYQLNSATSRANSDKVLMLVTDARTNILYQRTSQFDTTQDYLDYPRAIVGSLDTYNETNYATYAARYYPGVALTDGDLLSRDEAYNAIQKYGIRFYVLLVGNDADPFLARWLAETSGGAWTWIRTSAELAGANGLFQQYAQPSKPQLIK